MKNFTLVLICSFIFALPLHSEESDPAALTEAVKSVTNFETALDKAGSLAPDCPHCNMVEPDKKIDLTNKVEDLGTPFLYKNNKPFVYHIKRTKESPLKSTLKFKNGHTECAKMFVGANPYNGALLVDCLFKRTVYVDEELEFNLKKLPLPAEGEEQIIEIKIVKPVTGNSFYSVEAQVLKGPSTKVSKDKKFWGDGYNFEFSESKP